MGTPALRRSCPALALWYAYSAAAQHAEARGAEQVAGQARRTARAARPGNRNPRGVRGGHPSDRRRPRDAASSTPATELRSEDLRAERILSSTWSQQGPRPLEADELPEGWQVGIRDPPRHGHGQPRCASPRFHGSLPPQPHHRSDPRVVAAGGRCSGAGRPGGRRRERDEGWGGLQRPVRGDRQADSRRRQHLRRHRDGRRCRPGAPVEPDDGPDDRRGSRRAPQPGRGGARDRSDPHQGLGAPGDPGGRDPRSRTRTTGPSRR